MTAEILEGREGLIQHFVTAIGRRVIPRKLRGSLRLTMPSGRLYVIGHPGSGVDADLTINSLRVIARCMTRASVGFAESYMAGEWSSSDPAKLLRFYLQNRRDLNQAGRGMFFRSVCAKLWHRMRANTREGSRRNIEAHYDLGNAFYQEWLDPGLTYSSGLFRHATNTLAEAQTAKYRYVLDALDLEPGYSLLEIGCGWGGLAEEAADRGAAVTGITLSREQLAFARQRLGEKAHLKLEDYRDTEGTFDRLASIEMIEAVGEENWRTYFQTLHDRLKPGGIAVLQAITIDEAHFERYRRGADFIQRYIFPGGLLPTGQAMAASAAEAGLTYEKLEEFGASYAITLRLWRENFENAWPRIAAQGFDERFRRMWRYYLAYCEAGFAENAITVGFYRFVRPAIPASDRLQRSSRM
jgi:cyclopropane-fatty-acyl-phospholipid synthase